jgi:autotransporter-associated beta strand protein
MNTPIAAALRCSLIFLVSAVAYADSAQWNLNPASGDWNTATNWTPMTVPNGPADIATFGLSNTANVSISANSEVSGITFSAAASNPYTITASAGFVLTLSGSGIANDSGIAQNFVAAPSGRDANAIRLAFKNGTTAGTGTFFTMNGGTAVNPGPGWTAFWDSSSAGDGTFTNNGPTAIGTFGGGATGFNNSASANNATFINIGGTVHTQFGGDQGLTFFNDTATASHANFTNNAATVSGAHGGATAFDSNSTAADGSFDNNGAIIGGAGTGFDSGSGMTRFFRTSSAANGNFVNEASTASGSGGGFTEFYESSSAGNGTFIAAKATITGAGGGQIFFFDHSAGGTSQIQVFGNGNLDISGHNAPGLTIGSIEGDGDVFLGSNNLTVGSNNFNTIFSGVIQDGGFGTSLSMTGNRPLGLIRDSPNNGNPVLNRAVLKVYDPISTNTLAIQNGSLSGSAGGSLTKIGSGTLDLEGVNAYTGETIINNGTLQVDGSISSNTFVYRGGMLAGSGTINGNITNRGGTISPGDASGVPGGLTVGGNYTTLASQTAGGTLSIQIGGENVGQVSVLDVQGVANLGGFLDPVLVNGFVPKVGQPFTFLNYASFTGFLRIRNPVFDHGRKRWLLTFTPTSAVLTAVKNQRP